jgi:ferredoxin
MTRLGIDADRCTGHGRCYDLVPALFEPDEYGHGQVVSGLKFETIDEEQARMAVEACPEKAIYFEP